MIGELVRKSRSYRRFHQDWRVSTETLQSLIELGRLAPTTSNLQPLKYMLSNEPEKNARIFQTLTWAGYLRDWPARMRANGLLRTSPFWAIRDQPGV